MVPHVAERGYSFIGAGQYYLHDRKASTAERVAWTETLNLPTHDAARAMKCMAWTAMHAAELKAAAGVSLKGRKATNGPVYSCSLSWEKGAAPSDGHMRETGLASLGALGLSGHEAVLIRHTDTEHDHLHIVVNLVHPETGRRAKLSNDRLKLSEWAERYEREHGQIVCPKRVENNARRRNGEFVKHREEEARQVHAIAGQQATGFEAERERYEAKIQEAKRQGQEIVTPQPPRSRRVRASPFRSPLRRRRERRFTRYAGKRKYRADPDSRVTSRRGTRFMSGGKKKRGKSASAGTGRMWTANAFDMVRGRAATPRPAPSPGGHAGWWPRGPVPGF